MSGVNPYDLPRMSEKPEIHPLISPAVLDALGLSCETVEAMTLREFMDHAFSLGMKCGVTSSRAKDGNGNLVVRMEGEYFPAPVHVEGL